ncbi:MAG: IS66 family transposase [Pusillimonas sp.]
MSTNCENCKRLEKRVAELEQRCMELEKRNQELELLVRELLSRLNSNSSNSHKPPSSDPPQSNSGRFPSRAKSKGRKHRPGVARKMLPPEKVTQFITLQPDTCCRCGQDISKVSPTGDRVSQQLDLPEEIPLVVREFHRHVVTCPHCQANTTACIPSEYSSRLVGLKLAAFISTLRPKFHMSVQQIQELLLLLFGSTGQISEGTIVNVETGTSCAAASVYREARDQIQKASSIWSDETGWFHPGIRPWLWVATSENLSLFQLSLSRSSKALKHLLGNYSGFLTSDRWGSYSIYPLQMRQLCLSHLIRDFQKVHDRDLGAKKLGAWGVRELKNAMKIWKAYRLGQISQKQLNLSVRPIRSRFKILVKCGLQSKDRFMVALCKSLKKKWAAVWSFAKYPEKVEPTNNRAERALRKQVIWRKISQGNKSLNGLTFAQRLMTITTSLAQQGRNVMDFLETMLKNFRAGLAPPKLSLNHAA